MGKVILIALLMVVALSALVRPWVGIASYYLLALLGPQYIWWWVFDNLRVSLLVAVFTLAGFLIGMIRGEYDMAWIKNKQNLYLLVIWISAIVSYFFGPFSGSDNAFYSPEELIGRFSKILLYYFCAALIVNDARKLRFFCMVLLATVVYMTYWANAQYLTENWSQFNAGRLMGPTSTGSIYGDENAFATIFVAGAPFLYFLGSLFRPRWLRYLMWGVVPLAWHAVFLTGSRGALLAWAATLLLIFMRSKRKGLAVVATLLGLLFYQWQGGSVMKERSGSIASYEEESSAQARLASWQAGASMMLDHPVTGVGIGSYMVAMPSYSDHKPVIAHNTLVQYAAEMGPLAGICYLLVAYHFFKKAIRNEAWLSRREETEEIASLRAINRAATFSFAGLFVCSMFLSLNYYEIFFYLLIVSNALGNLCAENAVAIRVAETVQGGATGSCPAVTEAAR